MEKDGHDILGIALLVVAGNSWAAEPVRILAINMCDTRAVEHLFECLTKSLDTQSILNLT